MKVKFIVAVFIALAVLLLPATAYAQEYSGNLPDEYIFGENYTLENGETLDEDLYVFGGNVAIEEGAILSGDIWLTGGNLTIDGEVGGDVHATGGSVRLGAAAIVDGDIELTGASITRDPAAVVNGDINRTSTGPLELTPHNWNLPWLATMADNIFSDIFSVILSSFLLAAMAVVVVSLWPRQVALTGSTAIQQPVIAGGLGVLTLIAAVIVLALLAITIILSPVTLVGGLLLGLLAAFGWIALGFEVGDRLMHAFKADWALPVSAGLGTLLLTIAARGIEVTFDCIGWTVPFVIGMMGLGAALLTRLGTQPYPPILPAIAPAGPDAQVQVIPAESAASGGAEIYPASGDDTPPPVV